jgi:CheY-like chemotaxis protein
MAHSFPSLARRGADRCVTYYSSIVRQMNSQDLERALREALTHLYDQSYQPPAALCAVVGCPGNDALLSFQSTVMHAIEELRPAVDALPASPALRIYELLRNRFVLKLTLEETAERMNTSFSGVCRLQRMAVHSLARLLWDRQQTARQQMQSAGHDQLPAASAEVGQAGDWRAQAQRELASLSSNAPDSVSDVGEALQGACELQGRLLSKLDVRVDLAYLQPGLVTTVHRSALRQLFIAAIGRLAPSVSPGSLVIYAGLADGSPRITVTGRLGRAGRPDVTQLTADLLAPADVVIECSADDQQLSMVLDLPSVGVITVLAVDDNPDMARLYRRYADGTQYHILHVAHGHGFFDTVKALGPDLIVLDVMLPDVDGWELLMRLRSEATTSTIPVVVCSVVKEEELALSLGAAGYIAKPVRPLEFIRALDLARQQAAAVPPRELTSSAGAG